MRTYPYTPVGIYRHFRGGLYYVEGIDLDGKDMNNEEIMVHYYPLYDLTDHRANVPHNGRRRVIEDFFKKVQLSDIENEVHRFELVMRWTLPDILPGRILEIEYDGVVVNLIQVQVVQLNMEDGKVIVHSMNRDTHTSVVFELTDTLRYRCIA